MRLSVLDSSPVHAGESAVDAVAGTARLAVHADRLGYSRFWATELHGPAMNAGATPEITMARVASVTERIRVGAGSVLLNHRSAYRTAETFMHLHTMFPERVDLGLGRATAGPVVDQALQRLRTVALPGDDYNEQVAEVLSWLVRRLPAGHPFASVPFFDGVPGRPQVWILGSSPGSAAVAAHFGLPYAFAGFLNSAAAGPALAAYRRLFRPALDAVGEVAVAEPHCLLALNVSCGPTEQQAARVGASATAVYAAATYGQRLPRVPTADEAVELLGGLPSPCRYAPGQLPTTIHGTPEHLHDLLSILADDVGADEIAVQDFIADPAERLTSYDLLAEAFSLVPAREATHV